MFGLLRRPIPPDPLPPPVSTPLPGPATALATPINSLPTLIEALAAPSRYSLSNPNTGTILRLAFYSFALSPASPFHPLLFGDDPVPTLDSIHDAWQLAATQSGGEGEYSEGRRGKVCGHVFRAGESVYRCKDCFLDSSCVLCPKCFHASSHSRLGHDVTMSIHTSGGAGCCDCGDAEAFLEGATADCKFHSPQEGPILPEVTSDEVERLKATVEATLRVLIDWMITVLNHSPTDVTAPQTEAEIANCPALPRPIPTSSATTYPSSSYATWDSTVPPSHSSPSTLSTSWSKERESTNDQSSTPPGPWSVILWNDEKHSFKQVIEQVVRATRVTVKEAGDVAQRVDTYGRDVILVSSDTADLLRVSHLIASIDLTVTVRPALDTFYEQVAGELVVFMKDLCMTKVRGEGGVLADSLANVLLQRSLPGAPSRFQRLLNLDARLWKAIRKGLAEVYVMMLGVNLPVKKEFGFQFAGTYPRISDSYLLTDREPELSIIFFGIQVFTVPSLATFFVAKHRFLSALLSLLYSFFTEQMDPNDPQRFRLPPDPRIRTIDPESSGFKQKRYFQIFTDFNHLIASTPVKRFICSSESLVAEFASFLDLFTSMNPNRRAAATHVEYESDTWVTAFNVTIQLGKTCRTFGEAFRYASPIQLARALSIVFSRLGSMGTPRCRFHKVEFGGKTYQLVDFRVESDPVSFHHPLAWLFAEMVKNVEALDPAKLQAVGIPGLGAIVTVSGPWPFLAAMDHPLRVIVLVAQVRAGLWVRNGFGMRAQQLHYKEYSLRENTFDQDIYFLQTSFIVLEAPLVILAIIDRFQLLGWLLTDGPHPIYEPAQAFMMAEDMMYLLIILLSDPTYVSGLSNEQCLRRELVHNLCLGPTHFSDVMRRLSEKFVDDPALERILAEVAIFKHPVGISDQGTYTLRPEFYGEVDPYFPRYTRNQREDVEKVLREAKKKVSISDTVIVPRALRIQSGLFVALTEVFKSDVLHQIIFHALRQSRSREGLHSEVLLDESLHMTMLTLVEQPEEFAKFASTFTVGGNPNSTLLHLLAHIEDDDRLKQVREKVQWCLDKFAGYLGEAVTSLRKPEDKASPVKALDAKRAAAKARQASILEKFAQAQKSFLESSENIDAEDESEDEDMEGEAGGKRKLGDCIVCQDRLDSTRAFGALTLLQNSNFIRVTPLESNLEFQQEIFSTPSSLDRDASSIRPFGITAKANSVNHDNTESTPLSSSGFPQHSSTGIHASGCGHLMHMSCFQTYCRSLQARQILQPSRCHPENIERQEYICPLCKSLGNVLLPVTVDSPSEAALHSSVSKLDFVSWVESSTRPLPADILNSVEATRVEPSMPNSIQPWEIRKRGLTLRSRNSDERKMLDQLNTVAHSLASEAGILYPKFLSSTLFAYSLSVVEIGSRGTGEAAEVIPEQTVLMFQSLLSMMATTVDAQPNPSKGPSNRELTSIAVLHSLGGVFNRQRQQPTYRANALTTLIEVAAICPSNFYHAVTLSFYSALFQNFFSSLQLVMLSESLGSTGDGDDSTDEYISLADISRFTGGSDKFALSLATGVLFIGKLLYTLTLPFLRRAAILRRILFGYSGAPAFDEEHPRSEMSRLLDLLQIPHPSTVLIREEHTSPIALTIQAHLDACREAIPNWPPEQEGGPPQYLPGTSIRLQTVKMAPAFEHPTIYELVGLPRQLDTLIAESMTRKCASCNQVPAEPALCLFCGQMVCCQSFCCVDNGDEGQFGECNLHMWTCGGPVGIYFLIKKNTILYLYTDRGTFATPPYLDIHGEIDPGGRRRTPYPQFLHRGRYDEIRKAWLNHTLPTLVARKLEATTDHGGWETM